MQEYQEFIKQLKNEHYNIIGYVRKSKAQEVGEEEVEARKWLLELMSSRLRSRSLVDHIFVSYSCNSNDPLKSRDKKKQTTMGDFLNSK